MQGADEHPGDAPGDMHVGFKLPVASIKGRGAAANPAGRFAKDAREAGEPPPAEDGSPELPRHPQTVVRLQQARTIISRNASPDIPFSQSINPFQGCEHGCIYCYARPSHAYLDLSPGLDFETRLFAKPNAAALLREELAKPGYRCELIALGANTDPYQPIEREYRITRSILEVMLECRHPVSIVTKSAGVLRDLDLLRDLARDGLVRVHVSVDTLDGELARTLEPRAAAPHRRLEAIRRLAEAGVPCGVFVAPVIPFVNDADMEKVLEAAAEAGADSAHFVILRLPNELKDLFRDWLLRHLPMRAAHVMARVQDMRGGRDNDPRFGSRMRGEGLYADLIAKRFAAACRRLGLGTKREPDLPTHLFRPPAGPQGDLFR